jgi:hypothetical protein
MTKTLLALAAGASLLVLALPGPAGAAERRADGIRSNAEATEFSSVYRRYHRRYVVRRAYRPYYGGYGYGYPYAYGYGSPYYYRRPFVGLGLGPFGFGIW